MPYIYKITNLINGKIYVGKTSKTIEERWKQHLNDYKKIRVEKRPLYSAMNKYGVENFKIEKIEECSIDDYNEREKYWIEWYGSFRHGYNATLGGDGKPYIDRVLVINTYKKLQNAKKTSEVLSIGSDTILDILREQKIDIVSSQEIAKREKSKSVNMYDLSHNLIKVFISINEAGRYISNKGLGQGNSTGICRHIRQVCNKERKTAYKYFWEWNT